MREQPSWSYLPEEYVDPSAPTDYGKGRKCAGKDCTSGPDGTRGSVSRYQVPDSAGRVYCFCCQDKQIDKNLHDALEEAAKRSEREVAVREWRRETGWMPRGRLLYHLREHRMRAGYSQAQLAQAVGCAPSTIGHTERQYYGTSDEIIAGICRVLGCTPEDLTGEAKPEEAA